MSPVIMHIDMNSYFASCEQQDNLAWRGKPLGVCEHLGGIIIAASIEAKQWGIKTGTPVWEARKLYPNIILTPTNPDRYRFYTARFLKVLEDYTDQIEKYSIDEAFVNLTKACNILGKRDGRWQAVDPFVEAGRIAREIKRRMKREVGDWLSNSIGIGWNKLVAKICSDLQKPDGLVIVRPHQKEWLYERLKLTDIPGIAWRTERNLNALGIYTLRDLRDFPQARLVSEFGIAGYHFYQMGQLEGSWKENFEEVPLKSIGHMYTVEQEYRKPEFLAPLLYKLSEMVAARLRVNELEGHVLNVHVHTAEEDCFGHSRDLKYYVEDGREIFLQARQILKALGAWPPQSIYLVGVTLAGLRQRVSQQSLLPLDRKRAELLPSLDAINEKYDDFTIARVPAFLARDIIRDSVGFGRMKEFKKTYLGNGSHK